MYTGKGNRTDKIVVRRKLTKNIRDELKNLISKESWNEVFNHTDVNPSLKAFMDIFLLCIDTTNLI